MEWNRYYEIIPEVGKTVLVWRTKKRIYVVAKLEIDATTRVHSWRSVTGNKLKVGSSDGWLEFPYLSITETFN